ncbi:unnamed protein product [Gongylonema pulchrum]|uniref:TCF3 fusion partner n=1 Tax=Gongylonema pulchrum TaxID=637853 RepID=A0A183EKP7_9BILA|nr:unnamed protein product [Gongylonema pulchrum]
MDEEEAAEDAAMADAAEAAADEDEGPASDGEEERMEVRELQLSAGHNDGTDASGPAPTQTGLVPNGTKGGNETAQGQEDRTRAPGKKRGTGNDIRTRLDSAL